jgi:hypothetical protein
MRRTTKLERMALLEGELLYSETFKNVCDFSYQILKCTKNNVLPQIFPKDGVQVDRRNYINKSEI